MAPERGLEETTHGWKSFTAHMAVQRHSQKVPFWQEESYDHIVRDDFEFDRIARYILENPRKAGLEPWPYVIGKSD